MHHWFLVYRNSSWWHIFNLLEFCHRLFDWRSSRNKSLPFQWLLFAFKFINHTKFLTVLSLFQLWRLSNLREISSFDIFSSLNSWDLGWVSWVITCVVCFSFLMFWFKAFRRRLSQICWHCCHWTDKVGLFANRWQLVKRRFIFNNRVEVILRLSFSSECSLTWKKHKFLTY